MMFWLSRRGIEPIIGALMIAMPLGPSALAAPAQGLPELGGRMKASPMSAEKFWIIMDRAAENGRNPRAQLNALRAMLRELTLEEIISFEVAFRQYLNRAYSWDLWGAAYVIHGGCSDDGFEYFRRWLVSRGRAAYEAALADPDSLAQLDAPPGPDDVWEFELIYYVALEVFKEKGGEGDVRNYSELEAGPPRVRPSGEPFEESEEHLARRYPKLWQRFGAKPLR
jgi:Protein of unknown function (DUF4240)